MEQNEHYTYNYAAKDLKEANEIKDRFVEREKSKIEQLRDIDNACINKGIRAGLLLGIPALAFFGVGMTMVLSYKVYIVGSIIGITGMILGGLSYPVHRNAIKRAREQYRDEVLRLTKEIENESN